jgi:hypothetical protein
LHLSPTVVAAPGESAEVEETEVDRLLDLVNVVAGEEHVGDVRLDELDVAGGVGIRLSAQKVSDERRQVWFRHEK